MKTKNQALLSSAIQCVVNNTYLKQSYYNDTLILGILVSISNIAKKLTLIINIDRYSQIKELMIGDSTIREY